MEMTSEDDGTIQTWTAKDIASQLLKRHNVSPPSLRCRTL